MKLPDLPRTREQCTQFALTYSGLALPVYNHFLEQFAHARHDPDCNARAIKCHMNVWLMQIERELPDLLYTDTDTIESARLIRVAGVTVFSSYRT